MIFALIALIFKISKTKDEFGPATVLKLFQTQLFWSLVIPLLVTYGIWLIVSVLFLSPWHMITSVSVLFSASGDELLSTPLSLSRSKNNYSKIQDVDKFNLVYPIHTLPPDICEPRQRICVL